ncbi:M48 family metallopeptidase [Natrinema halophilum]|uniref:M48 family metalloprotease n=1 Tax=Natrinema halophilum TaxID=1699371 RepID=A0A7D5H131_9EURY|nr:M48 family metalloprotease [Natrinema halophilum]QLG47951.1 M48 family metalloprotease [Natrinema halophilum]
MGFVRSLDLAIRAALATLISGSALLGSLGIVLVLSLTGGVALSAYAAELLNAIGITVPPSVWPVVWTTVSVGGLAWFGRATGNAIRAERAALLERTTPVSRASLEEATVIDSAVIRLARQVDIPKPAVRIHSTSVPLAYTTYRSDDPIIRTGHCGTPVVVLSRGILINLSRSEMTAVLAHELAHIANDDHRLFTGVLLPLVAAETIIEDEGYPSSVTDVCASLLVFIASIGVGVFSRGRELAADRGAVTMTGDPVALATALEKLDGTGPDKPTTDLRKYARSTNAINILPSFDTASTASGLRSTHPSLETRLDHILSLSAERTESRR